MSIENDIVVLQVPYGNPGSLGEPLGLWTGRATVVGDASGGDVQLRFVPQNPTTTPTLDDQRLQYVWFIDAAGIVTTAGAVGNLSARIQTHWARPNSALPNPLDMARVNGPLFDGLTTVPTEPLIPAAWQRIPIFWDTQELLSGNNVLVHLQAQTNTLNANYTFSAYGRYYDRQILSNRGFGRLISPPAVSQFEG